MEDSDRGGESSLQSGGGEAATAAPDGVPGLQIQTQEATEVWRPAGQRQSRPQHQHGEAGDGGGVRHTSQEETRPEFGLEEGANTVVQLLLHHVLHLADGGAGESLLHLPPAEPQSGLLPTSTHSTIQGAFQPRNGEFPSVHN